MAERLALEIATPTRLAVAETVDEVVLPGVMERTAEEYARLFAAAGFRLSRITPTKTWVSVIEGDPV